MNFNEILYYILEQYAGRVNRKSAAKIAAKLLKTGIYDRKSSALKEVENAVNAFLKTDTASKQRFKLSDFVKSGKKDPFKKWIEEQTKKLAEPKKEEETDDNWEEGAEEPDYVEGEGWLGHGDYTEEVDAIVDKIWDTYSGTHQDVIDNQNLLDDIIEQARYNMTDEEIYYALHGVFPDIKKRIAKLANSIYDDYYGKDGRGGGAAFKRDVDKIMEALGVEDSEYKWW